MAWLIRRVDTLPSVLTPSTIYFVDNGDGTATQYVTGQDGVARLTGGGASVSVDWADLTGVPLEFPPEAHTQAFSTIAATPTTLAGYGITDAATAAAGVLAGTALQPGAQIPWTDVTGKPVTFPPDAHTQDIATITGLQVALDGKATVAQGALADSALQPGDSLPWADVTGAPALFSGAYADLTGKPTLGTAAAQDATAFATAAQGALAATASQPGHTHAQADVTGLVGALAGKQEALVSGTNIKTVNGTSLLGAGDVVVSGGATNLSYDAATRTIASDTGTDAILPVAGANAGLLTAADKAKLDGIATGATANSPDATLLARANHTGTQTAATISDFAVTVAANAAVVANTAKVTNATHTGDVTGATALTIAADVVTNVKLANMAANTIKGAVGAGDPADLMPAQVRTMLNVADGADVNVPTDLAYTAATRVVASSTGADATLPIFTDALAGLVPASGGGTTAFLRADGTFAVPAGGGGGGGYDPALGWAF